MIKLLAYADLVCAVALAPAIWNGNPVAAVVALTFVIFAIVLLNLEEK